MSNSDDVGDLKATIVNINSPNSNNDDLKIMSCKYAIVGVRYSSPCLFIIRFVKFVVNSAINSRLFNFCAKVSPKNDGYVLSGTSASNLRNNEKALSGRFLLQYACIGQIYTNNPHQAFSLKTG